MVLVLHPCGQGASFLPSSVVLLRSHFVKAGILSRVEDYPVSCFVNEEAEEESFLCLIDLTIVINLWLVEADILPTR